MSGEVESLSVLTREICLLAFGGVQQVGGHGARWDGAGIWGIWEMLEIWELALVLVWDALGQLQVL